MLWPLLGILFILSLLLLAVLLSFFFFKLKFWQNYKPKILSFYAIWFVIYGSFILFFTGPQDLNVYPSPLSSPYKLPWKGGVERFVAQGNRSFTSHRGPHLYAWDFVMTNGTPILASRDGVVIEVNDERSGIGMHANFIKIRHEEGQLSGYFHIQQKSSLVKVGDFVKQGQPIALSGMVGQTIFPHLHFAVFNENQSKSIPISFSDVEDGIPLAGRFYVSGNK